MKSVLVWFSWPLPFTHANKIRSRLTALQTKNGHKWILHVTVCHISEDMRFCHGCVTGFQASQCPSHNVSKKSNKAFFWLQHNWHRKVTSLVGCTWADSLLRTACKWTMIKEADSLLESASWRLVSLTWCWWTIFPWCWRHATDKHQLLWAN